jgi:hypothetical protein
MIHTGIFDPSGEIELTGDSRVQIRQGDRLLFSARPERVLPGNDEDDPTVILMLPDVAANQPVPPEWRSGVYLRAERFRFTNGGGWSADITASA